MYIVGQFYSFESHLCRCIDAERKCHYAQDAIDGAGVCGRNGGDEGEEDRDGKIHEGREGRRDRVRGVREYERY